MRVMHGFNSHLRGFCKDEVRSTYTGERQKLTEEFRHLLDHHNSHKDKLQVGGGIIISILCVCRVVCVYVVLQGDEVVHYQGL